MKNEEPQKTAKGNEWRMRGGAEMTFDPRLPPSLLRFFFAPSRGFPLVTVFRGSSLARALRL